MRARFKCISKMGIESFVIVLEPVDDKNDRSFFVDLPHGTISIGPLTKAAAAPFVVGEECFVDFPSAAAS